MFGGMCARERDVWGDVCGMRVAAGFDWQGVAVSCNLRWGRGRLHTHLSRPLCSLLAAHYSASVCPPNQLQVNPLLVDLVGEENTGRLADTIRLLITQVAT